MTEQQARQKIVDIAKSYLGSAQGSAGHKALIDTYNKGITSSMYKMTYTDPWCAATVSAWGMLSGMKDVVLPECSCSRMIALYQKHSLSKWQEDDTYVPQIGDLIIYDWDDAPNTFATTDNKGAPEHVGMIAEVNGSTLKVIEGNISKSVGYRTVQVNGRYIRGYCLPAFAKSAGASGNPPAPPAPPSPAKSIDEVAREVIAGKWGNNPQRASKLTAAGYDSKAVQSRVNEILKGGASAHIPAPTPSVSLDAIAWEVIAGEWGNNPQRKEKLTAAGYDAAAVQKRVNELLTQPVASENPNEYMAWKHLREKGLSREATAGIMGNIKHESNFNSAALGDRGGYINGKFSPGAFPNDPTSGGVCQWHDPAPNSGRFADMKKFVGSNWATNLIGQLDYLWQEMSSGTGFTGGKATFETLKAAKTVREASDIFMCKFERPADQSETAKARRAASGQVYYDKYKAV